MPNSSVLFIGADLDGDAAFDFAVYSVAYKRFAI